ncbi:MAG: macrolide ABC transporter ATP-binding protein, partial [Candidatus Harrisonbacteria bacterium CG10_big_fil_rev_8_21_14_0_10_38_8]
ASSGSYFFEGDDVTDKSEEGLAELRNIKIGFVFQAFNLLSRTRVIDNVVLPLIYANVPKAEQYVRAKEVLEKVGLTHRINHYSNQLSGGEKQRVALARALINNPRVIFADEPTGNLDSKSGQAIMELLQELNEQGRTIILVTHETFAAESAKRVIKLTDGVVVDDSLVTNRKITKRDGYSK